jgi:hypothetical protein
MGFVAARMNFSFSGARFQQWIHFLQPISAPIIFAPKNSYQDAQQNILY